MRQAETGEAYMTSLMHVRGECRRCKAGQRCAGCEKMPCDDCTPVCIASNNQFKCVFDDIGADNVVRCVGCGRTR